MPGFPANVDYSTYEQVDCPECHRKMWLGKRGKAEVEAGRASMRCMQCLLETNYIDMCCVSSLQP